MKIKWYRGYIDYWSISHFLGSFLLAHLLMAFFGFWGMWVAFFLGITYEIICDGILSKEIEFFDGNGGSWSDVFCDLAGCVLAIFI